MSTFRAPKRNSNRVLTDAAYREEDFPALRLARAARVVRKLGHGLIVLLFFIVAAMLFAPWQQSIRGEGAIVAFDPAERTRIVPATVNGRIAKRGEGVQENAYVKKGQLLFMIENLDPDYLPRLQEQLQNAEDELRAARQRLEGAQSLLQNNRRIVKVTREELEAFEYARDELMKAYDNFVTQANTKLLAQKSKLAAANAALTQTKADYDRQNSLYKDGIASEAKQQIAEQKYRKAEADVEVAKQEVDNAIAGLEGKKNEQDSKRQEWQAKINKVQSELTKAENEVAKAQIDINKTGEEINQKNIKLLDQKSKVATQQQQEVFAPVDGYIMDLAVFDIASIVKPGDQLCRIVPEMTKPAVQIWVAGNDAPLIDPGRHVRLQFEGWPAVQFSGWPSVAVGTFGGTVSLVDATDNGRGEFRVLIVPDKEDKPWPEYPYLRQGVRVNGWVLLDQVALGYEVWRRMNGFPPSLKSKGDDPKLKAPKIKI